ncbi:MAG TPA: glutathione synthase [Myxococcales bacterium]|jgi:glutathione synthase|nr:glutathione synthase [Myxococcales bacterium]
MRIGFLMDPIESVRVDHDSTFALMLDCQRRGLEIRELRQEWLYVAEGRAHARMRTLEVQRQPGAHYRVAGDFDAPLSELDILFLRKDPPVDVAFVRATQIVELGGGGPLLINHPLGLRAANEKLFALRFPDLAPATLVSRDLARLRAFIDAQGGDGVVKPLDGCGGQGVLRVRRGDPNLSALLEIATDGGKVPVMAQAYLPAVQQGDKRIILLAGEPIGAVLRVPAAGELRANFASGGSAAPAPLTARDREICRRLAPALNELGLWLTGIDVIGGKLTEVNVTSPTGLVEIDALSGLSLEERVIDFALERAARQQHRAAAGI